MAMNYWLSLPFATTYRFIKQYPTIEELRTKIIRHAFKHNIEIIGNGDELNMENLIANRRITRKKRSLSPRRSVSASAAAKRLKTAPSAAPIAQEQAELPITNAQAQQPMEQEQAQQPMEQAEQPITQAQAQQPITQGLVQTAEQPITQAQAPIAPPFGHLPNVNGARRVVHTNTLVLNGLVIEVDRDTFMVNATMMCKAAGKKYFEYARHDKGKLYIKALEAKTGIPAFDLIQSKPGHNGGTMVHRLVAYGVAQWCDENIAAQFVIWIDQLLLTGRVELGNEMNAQQLEDAWRRINEEVQAKASADVKAEQDRCQEIILQRNELEQQLATVQEAQKLTKAAQDELVAIKTREDLEAAIQFQVNTTAPTISSFKEGDNVLYLARIDETKFKYGHTKNLKQRLEPHTRPGAYPTFELVWIVKSNNGVASEDQLHAYVKKTKIGVEYGNQREVVVLESVEALQRMMNKMQKCCRQQQTSEGSEVVLRRIKAKTSIKMKKIDARVDMEKIKAELEEKKIAAELEEKNKDREMKKLQMVLDGLINFDQFLLIK